MKLFAFHSVIFRRTCASVDNLAELCLDKCELGENVAANINKLNQNEMISSVEGSRNRRAVSVPLFRCSPIAQP